MNKIAKTNFFRKSSLVLVGLLASLFTYAQGQPETEDFFLSNNKIYVVVLVLTTIFIGLFLVLIFLERKIKKIERNQRSGN